MKIIPDSTLFQSNKAQQSFSPIDTGTDSFTDFLQSMAGDMGMSPAAETLANLDGEEARHAGVKGMYQDIHQRYIRLQEVKLEMHTITIKIQHKVNEYYQWSQQNGEDTEAAIYQRKVVTLEITELKEQYFSLERAYENMRVSYEEQLEFFAIELRLRFLQQQVESTDTKRNTA